MWQQHLIYYPNIKPLKYKYQSGLETLVVYTMNYGHNKYFFISLRVNVSSGE